MLKNLVRNLKERKNPLPSEEELLAELNRERLPRHVAIIMDGNGRWARRRGLPRTVGHRAGMESIRDAVRLSAQLGIACLTLYAFSTENWKRPRDEVNFLMNLLVEYLHREIDELCSNNVQIHPIGMLAELPAFAREALRVAVERSKDNDGLILNLALNYGGRSEIVEAARLIAREAAAGRLKPDAIDESTIANCMYTAGQPDPDLLIRPAGDYRVSNFLLWQMAYTEFWMTPVMWPDFRRIHFLQALVDYQHRERRFGGLIKSQAGEN